MAEDTALDRAIQRAEQHVEMARTELRGLLPSIEASARNAYQALNHRPEDGGPEVNGLGSMLALRTQPWRIDRLCGVVHERQHTLTVLLDLKAEG